MNHSGAVILISIVLLLGGCLEVQVPPAQISELEMADIAEAEAYSAGLNERILKEETEWRRLEENYIADIDMINTTDLTKCPQGMKCIQHPINAAEKEKKRHDRERIYNVRLYDIELSKLREQIIRLESLYTNQLDYNQTRANTTAMKLQDYRAEYNKTKLLRTSEFEKRFELPAQVTEGERFRGMNIGRWDEYTVRYGSGPALADIASIKAIADIRKLSVDYTSLVLE